MAAPLCSDNVVKCRNDRGGDGDLPLEASPIRTVAALTTLSSAGGEAQRAAGGGGGVDIIRSDGDLPAGGAFMNRGDAGCVHRPGQIDAVSGEGDTAAGYVGCQADRQKIVVARGRNRRRLAPGGDAFNVQVCRVRELERARRTGFSQNSHLISLVQSGRAPSVQIQFTGGNHSRRFSQGSAAGAREGHELALRPRPLRPP